MRMDWSVFAGAECVEIELFDRFDLIAEEIDADRQADLVGFLFEIAGEIDVDDPAAHGEIARHFDLVETVVAVIGEPDDQLFRFEVVARS